MDKQALIAMVRDRITFIQQDHVDHFGNLPPSAYSRGQIASLRWMLIQLEMDKSIPDHRLIELLAQKHGIEEGVAMDVLYLNKLKQRIIETARAHPELRDFPVHNPGLEKKLDQYDMEYE